MLAKIAYIGGDSVGTSPSICSVYPEFRMCARASIKLIVVCISTLQVLYTPKRRRSRSTAQLVLSKIPPSPMEVSCMSATHVDTAALGCPHRRNGGRASIRDNAAIHVSDSSYVTTALHVPGTIHSLTPFAKSTSNKPASLARQTLQCWYGAIIRRLVYGFRHTNSYIGACV